jgi:hypothetical protein
MAGSAEHSYRIAPHAQPPENDGGIRVLPSGCSLIRVRCSREEFTHGHQMRRFSALFLSTRILHVSCSKAIGALTGRHARTVWRKRPRCCCSRGPKPRSLHSCAVRGATAVNRPSGRCGGSVSLGSVAAPGAACGTRFHCRACSILSCRRVSSPPASNPRLELTHGSEQGTASSEGG